MRVEEAFWETGISRDMIRYYEKLGLIHPARRENGYRNYSEDDLYLLTVVKYLSNLGVPLKAIRGAFDSGRAEKILNELDEETMRLERLKAQLDARIAAARDSRACFSQFAQGRAMELYDARTRYLISYGADPEAIRRARQRVSDRGDFFQFYYRQRAEWDGEALRLGPPDRGLLLYDKLPEAERLSAQRSLRAVIAHRSGRILNAGDLTEPVREAARITGSAVFTVLIHQFFQQNGAEASSVVCAEILLGERKRR